MEITDSHPECVVDNRLEWITNNHPEWIPYKRPKWMANNLNEFPKEIKDLLI